MKYLIVIEKAGRNFSAFAPDLPGCVATGKTPAATRAAMRAAVALHIAGMREDGLNVPRPSARAAQVAPPPSRSGSSRRSRPAA